MIAMLVVWAILAGIAAWLPAPHDPEAKDGGWVGLRMFSAFAVLVLVLVVSDLLDGSYRVAAYSLMAVAAAGHLRLLAAVRGGWCVVGTHPVTVFPLIGIAVVALRGGVSYEPLAWDELSIWAAVAQQGTALDHFTGPDITAGVVGYTPGWPMALGFPSVPFGRFDDDRAAVVPFLMHVALLGLLFDVMRWHLGLARWSPVAARLGAWGSVLALLTVEASWKLAPLNLLIEKPQIYSLVACLAIATLAVEVRDWRRPALHFGLALALGYALKSAMLAFVPAVPVLWAATAWARRDLTARAWVASILMVAPFVMVYGLWVGLGPKDSSCLVSPLGMIPSVLDGADADRALDLARRLFGTIAGYLADFKPWLTAAAVAGLVAGLTDRRIAPTLLAYLIFVILYEAALYVYHLYCFSPYYFETLNSWDRFTRVPLRVLHVIGVLAGCIRLAPVLSGLARTPAFRGGLALAVVVLGAWQALALHRQFGHMQSRSNETPDQVALVRHTRAEAMRLIRHLDAHPERTEGMQLIAQGDTGYRMVIANYYLWPAVGVTLRAPFRWSAEADQVWAVPISVDDPVARMARATLVWPLVVDDWMVSLLAERIDDPVCRRNPEAFYFWPVPGADRFECVARPD